MTTPISNQNATFYQGGWEGGDFMMMIDYNYEGEVID